jgi:hypothetical protein
MEKIFKMYGDLAKKDPLIFVKDDIHTYHQLIKLCEEDIQKSQDEKRMVKLQKEIKEYQDGIIRLQEMIDSHNRGGIDITINITHVETNMKF